ncbi:MAG: thioredoxin family protein [Christensenellales bacterium]|jgi:glutaredoxin
MKEILFFTLENCPYCREAERWIRELCAGNPAYGQIPIRRVDENEEPALANSYDYWYVPTFYVEGVKVHEGAATKEKIKAVLDKALQPFFPEEGKPDKRREA